MAETAPASNISLQSLVATPLFRQLGLLVGIAASIALGVSVVLWSRTPEMLPLYSNLSSKDSAAVIEALQRREIPFRVDDITGTVMVSGSDIHRTRIQLASEGIPSSAGSGFEWLSEGSPFGTSQFMERSRYYHALERELAKSISSMQSVSAARVHLAVVNQQNFLKRGNKSSASVLVDIPPGHSLEHGQVSSIVHLVASSVPGLNEDRVTVVDEKGSLLSGDKDSRGLDLSDRQFDYIQRIEKAYALRIEEILSPIVGRDHVKAQITARVDFTALDETQEHYNPDLPALRSEQIFEEKSASGNKSGGIPGATSNDPSNTDGGVESVDSKVGKERMEATRNYELDRTISHIRSMPGRIERLAVAVLVDDHIEFDKEGEPTRIPRTQEELTRIEQLVREAIGYDGKRGDTLNVMNAPFKIKPKVEEIVEEEIPIWQEHWVQNLIKQALGAVVALAIVFLILRPAFRYIMSEPMMQAPVVKEKAEFGGSSKELQEQMQLAEEQRYVRNLDEVTHLAQEDPKRVAKVIKNWVAEDE